MAPMELTLCVGIARRCNSAPTRALSDLTIGATTAGRTQTMPAATAAPTVQTAGLACAPSAVAAPHLPVFAMRLPITHLRSS